MGRNRAGVESAQAARDIAVARYEKAIQTAFKEVADALTARQALAEQLQAQQQQTDAERERYRLVDLSYRNGMANSLDNYFRICRNSRSIHCTCNIRICDKGRLK